MRTLKSLLATAFLIVGGVCLGVGFWLLGIPVALIAQRLKAAENAIKPAPLSNRPEMVH